MTTQDFRTKTEIREQDNGAAKDSWVIALDAGYSGVKLYAPNKAACFPAYAKLVSNNFEFLAKNPPSAYLYKDLTKPDELWLVGEKAQDLVSSRETTDSETSLYGRDRYRNRMFKAEIETGLGIALMANKSGTPNGDKIVVQTGLPDRYMSDEEDLKDVIAGDHHFALKIGSREWQSFMVTIKRENIYVMSQPKGTLFSICIDKNGKYHQDTQKYLKGSGLIFDPGFGTLDIFSIEAGAVGNGETFDNLGMKRVLQETAKGIKEAYNIDVTIPAMQKYLETGKVVFSDRKNFISTEYDFTDILVAACKRVCEEAIAKMAELFDLSTYNYLVVTGGTGDAWFDIIAERLKGLKTLQVIKGNQNDGLPLIYSNVRGYYLYRVNKIWKGQE